MEINQSALPNGNLAPRKEVTPEEVLLATREAVRRALIMHKKNGNPICEWRDGKVVWIQPEDIKIPE